ncbi:hypothetical protein OSB04_024783 [Centaurea solstitialis]|uniref:Uncharacterized protein n=1 Tax=Centaurea solstitialis TaxID=347529 RepID=A0AA38WE65_9ASTR|nr:hypothetical protein OSB04_024783 [Centaurea solstitialis]
MESIPILRLTTPKIEMKDEVQMNEEIYSWSLDIWKYLKHDQLPENKMEARKIRSKASRYTIFEDQLYRRSTSGLLLRCVVSQAQMNRVLQEMHDGECGNYTGAEALLTKSHDRDTTGVLYEKTQSDLAYHPRLCATIAVDPALLRPDEMIMILNLYLVNRFQDQDQETNEPVLQSTDPVH